MSAEVFTKLSQSLTDTIRAIEDESGSGIGGTGRALMTKLKGWRDEVDGMRSGKGMGVNEQDDGGVERKGEGGLYSD